MVDKILKYNAADLEKELKWFGEVVKARMDLHRGKEKPLFSLESLTPPVFKENGSKYADFIRYYALNSNERLLLTLAMVPHLRPALLDVFFSADPRTGRPDTVFGGIRGHQHGGFLPTAETVLFLLAGNDLQQRFELYPLFDAEHVFAAHNILKLEPVPDGEPFTAGALTVSQDILDHLTLGKASRPDLSMAFPARRITTTMEWEDLVLEEKTLRQVEEIKSWLQHGNTLLYDWGMAKKLRKGYRCLFYGPPGTGKTLAASLLGKFANRDVYRIDLSLVVSKYIGETEKNLSRIFDQARHKNWILFFDEADALFGKRTSVSDAHDRYANQEVSYLLQRVEEFDGVVLLASNMKENLDDSFRRRFESIIYFPMPRSAQRLKIWNQGLPGKAELEKEIRMKEFADQYEIAGGSIMNVIAYASLKSLERNEQLIRKEDLMNGIRRELEKEGRTG